MDNELIKHRDCFGLTPGLSGMALKIAGVIMMVFDHIHQMFYTNGAPLWFTWIGRPVLPLFLFLCVEGFTHTHSRKKYLLRLFLSFEIMNIVSLILTSVMPNDDVMLINNVFQTLLLLALYMFFIEMFIEGMKDKKAKKIIIALLLMLLVVFISTIMTILIDVVLDTLNHTFPSWVTRLMYMVIPNLMFCEGGFTAVFMGIVFYLLGRKRIPQILCFAAMSIISLVMFVRAGNPPLSGSAQWLMIFAVIPFMLYNGERGKGSKYFFYVFYPAHIYLLYIIAYLV